VLAAIARRTRAWSGRAATAPALLGCAALVAGCGGSEQNAHEPNKTFAMQIVRASFPSQQAVARPATMEIAIHNSGEHAVPNVAVTVDSFNYRSSYPELAAAQRPVWAIEQGPGKVPSPPVQSEEVSKGGSAGTAYVNTWALGALPAGQTRTFTWRVVAVKAGTHVVHYTVGAGLAGRAKARASSGSLQGEFAVDIAGSPAKTHVNPATGRVESGAAPATP
jgi:hypothetical protein